MEEWSKLPLVEKHTCNYFLNHFLLLLIVRSWSWLQLLVLPKIWASKSSKSYELYEIITFDNIKLVFIICEIITFDSSKLVFFYLLRERKFNPIWNYKKWGDALGCGSSHLCLYWCWDILYQIGDLLELWSIVQKIPKCWWVL
jgi:hypothetical protein